MVDLLAGARIKAIDFPPTEGADDDSTQTLQVADDWRSGTPGQAVTFIAPTTGRVKVNVHARCRCATAGAAATVFHVSYELRLNNNAGVIIQSEAHVRGFGTYISSGNTLFRSVFATILQESLTPGQVYWASLRYQITPVSNVEIRGRRIFVEPAT